MVRCTCKNEQEHGKKNKSGYSPTKILQSAFLISYQQGEPRATAWGLRLAEEIFQRFSCWDKGLVLLQVSVVALPLRLPLIPEESQKQSFFTAIVIWKLVFYKHDTFWQIAQ